MKPRMLVKTNVIQASDWKIKPKIMRESYPTYGISNETNTGSADIPAYCPRRLNEVDNAFCGTLKLAPGNAIIAPTHPDTIAANVIEPTQKNSVEFAKIRKRTSKIIREVRETTK